MRTVARRLRLDGIPNAVPRARRMVREALAGTPFDHLSPDAEVVVSELATNAILHGKPPIELAVRTTTRATRIEVRDASRIAPVVGLADTEGMTGRGLTLVGSLAARWGVERLKTGKLIWAEMSDDVPEPVSKPERPAPPADVTDPSIDSDAEERFTIVLGDVPTDLLVAAKAHVDNLVREFVLAASGAASGASALIPAHLGRLIDVVTTRFAEPRRAIKQQALGAAAAGEERTRLVLTLPVSAAAAGLEYLAALDEADAYARAARLLTLATPPEHRAFRQWYVRGLVDQLEHAAAGQPASPPPSFEQHVLRELRAVAAAQLILQRSARLQLVTAALGATTTVEEVAAAVVSEGVATLGASGGSLLIPDGEGHLSVPGAVGYPEELVSQLRAEPLDAALPAATAMRTGEAVWLESRQERERRFPALTGLEPDTVAMCAVPLTVAGEMLGALRFSFTDPRLFDEDERRFVLALAAQTAQALQRAQLFAAERAARARTAFLAEAIELLTSSLKPDETLAHLTSLVVPAIGDYAAVHLIDEPGENGGPVADVLRTGQSIHARHKVVVPLIARDTVLGALAIERAESQPPFTDDDLKLLRDVAARAAVAVQNAQAFQRERDTAIALQQGLLPQRLPDIAGAEFAWRYLPAGVGTHVGGDWYDVIDLEEGRVALVIGDVMGRGVHAAALMGQLRATARAYASADLPPAEILSLMDTAVARLEQGQITTAAFAVLDPATGEMTIASAGHLPPLLVAGSEASYVDVVPGPPLGTNVRDYPETAVLLPPGGVLLLYTDGLVEDRTRPVDAGMCQLQDAVRGATSAEDVCDRALAALNRTDGHEDDTAMLAVGLPRL